MKNGYNVIQCNGCSFVYADTHVTQDELDIYYKELSKYEDKNIGTGGGFTPEDKDRLVKTAVFIEEHVPDKNIRIADIGCANGGLLKELKHLGFQNLVGVDPSASCVDITIAEVGCEAYQYSIFNIDKNIGKFDLVILSHVLEHILDLPSIMDRLNELVVDGGLIYVECPDAENYYKIIHAPFQEFNTEHINHFTEISFENLAALHGYNKIFTSNKTLKLPSGEDYHAVYGLFKKAPNPNYTLKKDDIILENIEVYIQESDKIFKEIEQEITDIDVIQQVALYGIGQFAFKLLTSPALYNRKLKLFDNNDINIGKAINGRLVLAANTIAKEFLKEEFTIVITSLIHEDGIRKQIQGAFKSSGKFPVIKGFKKLLTKEQSYAHSTF